MSMASLASDAHRGWSRPAIVLFTSAALGVAWNVFGLERFFATAFASHDQLIAQGLSAAQATLYVGLPGWMTAAFAIGVLGGLAGSILMLMRRRWAVPVLSISLAAYVALFAGDWVHGVFAAFPGQFAILSTVVAIATGLLAVAVHARRHGLLR